MAQSGQQTPQPKSWELSLYELHRTPQEAITDDTEIAISPRSLHSELMCPICLDMLKCTMTTKECLHRFCQECIITALRSGNKECPTCRKKLISKRSLRPDPNFDALIDKIYPSRDEYDAHQEKVLQKLNKHHNQQALTSSIEEGLRIQAQNRLQRMMRQQKKAAEEQRKMELEEAVAAASTCQINVPQGTSTPKPVVPKKKAKVNAETEDDGLPTGSSDALPAIPSSSGESSSHCDGRNSSDTVQEDVDAELVLRPHPDFADADAINQQARFIKTVVNATVDHLARYLTLRMDLERSKDDSDSSSAGEPRASHTPKDFVLFALTSSDSYQLLEGSVSLDQVHERFWRCNKPMELYYAPAGQKEEVTQ